MRAISFSAIALLEEAETYLYYESQSAGLGDRFLKEVETALDRVSQNPTHYGYSDSTKTIRDVALEKFPYIIIFQIFENTIVIYNIHHTCFYKDETEYSANRQPSAV